MMAAILGRKLGMTELFDEAGHRVSVTLIEAEPNVVVHVKTRERDGYEALQVGVGAVKERRLPKPLRGVYVKAKVAPQRHLRELRGPTAGAQPGQTITVEVFSPGDVVDATGAIRGLRVVKVEPERNLLYLRGAVPGVRGSLLLLRSAKRQGRAARKAGAKGKERAR